MTVWFTADPHFEHEKIIKYCNRPFHSIGEMNAVLIANWNCVVKPLDTVWILGDFALKHFMHYFEQLNGYKYFIQGDHDDIPKILGGELLHIMKDVPGHEDDKNFSITLCHWAMRSWQRSHYGTWHLYGHHHGALPPYGLSFDVGVDAWDYFPVSLEQVTKKMATLKPIILMPRRPGGA
jgi:calcineurin-like phosphoesterase family protein